MTDALGRVATLLAEVGACYERGRRYRAIAALCEERIFERALDIGSEVRMAWRRDTLTDDGAAAIAELEELLAACKCAISDVYASAVYRDAAAAWASAKWNEVGCLAPAIFTAVERDAGSALLHHAVPLAGGRRSPEHFIPAAECATRICSLLQEGLKPPDTAPELGADETLRAVILIDDPSGAESPITLALERAAIALPVSRIVPGGETLIYTARLQAPMRVRCAPAVSDEWWMVKPEAYRRYVDELGADLAARGVPIEHAAPS